MSNEKAYFILYLKNKTEQKKKNTQLIQNDITTRVLLIVWYAHSA